MRRLADGVRRSGSAFELELGGRLPGVTAGYRTWGTLDPDGGNAVGGQLVGAVPRQGGLSAAQMLAQVASGDALLVVGTHAVIQQDVVFRNLGLAVVPR